MRSRIKTAELHDIVSLYPLTEYNDPNTGLPIKVYGPSDIKIYGKVRRTIGSSNDSDKVKVVNSWTITVRIDSIAYKVEDKITWSTHHMIIKEINQVDMYYQNLICYDEH